MNVLLGNKITALRTIDTMYGHNMLAVRVEGIEEEFRINVSEFMKLLPSVQLLLEKKRKYNHVTIAV